MKSVYTLKYFIFSILIALTTSCETFNDLVEDKNEDINIQSGLMAYYTFDNGTAEDITNNKYNGTLMNKPSFVSETTNGTGKAIFFNSLKEQYMSIPYNPFKGIENYTATMWVKDFAYGAFLDIKKANGDSNFNFFYDEDGLFKFRLSSYNWGLGTFEYDAKSLINGKWHMLAFTRSKNVCELFVDGILVATKEVNDYTISNELSILINNHMYFDNLRLYNRVINAKEVKTIYDLER